MGKRVVVVDDEEAIALALEYLLRKAGYEVAVAGDGESALHVIEEFQPDLVLLDVMLPGRDGYEVCQTIRSSGSFPQPKVVMLTAKGREAERAKGLAVGADAYVVKPFASADLLAKVEMLLTRNS
ncbi:MAG: response regulator [Hydrogenophilus sp.]|nr:response regulator [Hydrogenophilus sp.]